MIHIDFLTPDEAEGKDWYETWRTNEGLKQDWFQKWVEYRDKKAKLDSEEPDSEVWRRLKKYLFVLFHKKCGYCESLVEHVYHGDVDHYRPKSQYAWLTYEITNYVPSCGQCNSGGKGAKFPVVGAPARKPGDEHKESPLLLDPYDPKENPSKHLRFVAEAEGDDPPGFVVGITKQGRATIATLKLNREDLVTMRQSEQNRAMVDFNVALLKKIPLTAKDVSEVIRQQSSPSLQYSAARREAIDTFRRAVAGAAA